MADIVSLAQVKSHPSFRQFRDQSQEEDDEFIQLLIEHASARFETQTGRWFPLDTYTEVFSPGCEQFSLQLRAYPVTSITNVWETLTNEYTEPASSSFYSVRSDTGLLVNRYAPWTEGPNAVKVTYVGGYQTLPADLTVAAVLQIGFEYHAASKSFLKQEAKAGGTATYQPLDLLPIVRSTLGRYSAVRF